MLTIRFNRTGKRNQPHFRIALQEKSKAPGKRHVELLGSYDPVKKVAVIKKDRLEHWMKQGVEVTDAVHNLLVREGVIDAPKRAKKMERPAPKEAPKTEEVVAETPVEEKEAAPAEAEAKAPEA